MSSSELNSFVLGTDRVVRLGQMILDVRALDQTVVGGKSAYNATDLTYDAPASTHNGTITNYVTANSALNGLSANAGSTPVVPVSATASFGAVSSSANSGVTHLVSAESQFGSITTQAISSVGISATASADLNGLNATANTIPLVYPILTANLGGLTAQVISQVTDLVSASAELGAITANAIATVIPKPQPQPEQQYGSNRPYAKPQQKVEPVLVVEPVKIEIVKTEPARPVRMPATIIVKASEIKITPSISAQSQIEWSILDDEAELLLLL